MMPALVCKLAYGHEAWIVGSAAKPDANHATLRDYDVLVPLGSWQAAAMLIPADATPNTFGGWKCQSEGKEVDVWPGDLGWLMTNDLAKWAWHPRTGTRISQMNVRAQATLPARASLERGVKVEVTGDHQNWAAGRGCSGAACSLWYSAN